MFLNPRLEDIVLTPKIGFDLETTGLWPWKGAIIDLIAIKNSEGTTYVLEADRYSRLDLEALFQRLKNSLIIGHNIKFDVNFVFYHYKVLFNNVFCTQIGSQILENGKQKELKFNLLSVLDRYLAVKHKFSAEEKASLQKQFTNEIVRANLLALPNIRTKQITYAAEDVEHLIPLYEKLQEKLYEKGLNTVSRLEHKVLPVLSKMECCGVKINKADWLNLIQIWEQELNDLTKQLDEESLQLLNGKQTKFNFRRVDRSVTQYDIFGSSSRLTIVADNAVNYSSADQILKLWEAFGEVAPTDSEGKESVGEDVITTYATEHEGTRLHRFIKLLLDYREVDKLLSTYGHSFLAQLDDDDCIHTQYTQTRTETGRLSSKEPNLQNIPSDSAPTRNIRQFFIARPGYKLITCDMAGAEVSIAADFSKEPLLLNSLLNGADMHSELASVSFSIIFKQPVTVNKSNDTITVDGYTYKLKNLRDEHKSVVFAKFYKAGAKRVYTVLASYINRHCDANDRMAVAQQISESLDARMPVLSKYLSDNITKAKHMGFLTSDKLGRIRYFPSSVYGEAANYQIQGCNANALKIALVKLDEYLTSFTSDGRLLMNIHDEVVVEVREDLAEEVAEFVRKTMADSLSFFFTTLKGDASVSISNFWKK